MRGLIALPTIRNAPGIDLVVVDPSGLWHANVQVKTSKNKVAFWPVGSKYKEWSGPDNYYAFLRWLAAEARFEVFLEKAAQVIREAAAATEADRARGCKEWVPSWYLPKDPFALERVRQQWIEFGVRGCG